jgi:hypothetical protein
MATGPGRDEMHLSPSPLRRDVRAPGTWAYAVNYVLLGSAAILILLEIIDSGSWRKLGMPLLFLGMAIGNLARMRALERRSAEARTAPDGREP